MAQVINTNISSLMVRRNANNAQAGLQTSLQRLSSGLRINSAKDDAAGLSISNRFTSEIRGNAQAIRNANDGISLAQTGEGALNEVNNILQRVRELSIQSANGTNSSSDRASLQDEVNQLQQELSRIGDNTTFNGLKLLDGTLSNSTFQVGSQANQTISLSINDARATALGSNSTTADNTTNGISVATRNSRVTTDGAEVGAAVAVTSAAGNNGITGETLTIADASGSSIGTVTVAANAEASTTATSLNALDGVTATADNEVTLSSFTSGGAESVIFTIGSGADSSALTLSGVTTGSSQAAVFSALRDAINADSTLSGAGVLAGFASNGTDLVIRNNDGDDLDVTLADGTQNGASATAGVDVAGIDGVAVTLVADVAATDSTTSGGRLQVNLAQGYTISSSASNQQFAEAANTTVTADATNVGVANTNDLANNAANYGNANAAQTVTIVGGSGTATAAVSANATAAGTATAINAVSSTTGVSAEARTTASLSSLSADGTVGFSLYGKNTTAVAISAAVTTTDLSALVSAINNETGTTGITAAIGGSGNSLDLTLETGENINISDFTSSAASGASSADMNGTEVSLDVAGGNGAATKIYDGGIVNQDNDSTVVGGSVTFRSADNFNVFSSVDATLSGGNSSLFNVASGQANTSTLSSVNNVDISTQQGATDALAVIDGAIAQVDDIRSSLGAIQNRFDSAIANLDVAVENQTAARSRIMDADFAVESTEMTRNQILQQASFSMLAQANSAPQQVLSLLQ